MAFEDMKLSVERRDEEGSKKGRKGKNEGRREERRAMPEPWNILTLMETGMRRSQKRSCQWSKKKTRRLIF